MKKGKMVMGTVKMYDLVPLDETKETTHERVLQLKKVKIVIDLKKGLVNLDRLFVQLLEKYKTRKRYSVFFTKNDNIAYQHAMFEAGMDGTIYEDERGHFWAHELMASKLVAYISKEEEVYIHARCHYW